MKPAVQQEEQPKKKGRPATGRKRTQTLQIRISEAEHASLANYVSQNGTTITNTIRELISQITVPPTYADPIKLVARGKIIYLSKEEALVAVKSLVEQL